MWWHNGSPDGDRLNTYWDAVVGGASPEALAGAHPALDPNLQEAIAQVRALHRRRRPDPAFALHLETTLMNAFATTYVATPAIRPLRDEQLVTRPAWLLRRERELPRRWGLGALATVALIAITLAIFFFALRGPDQPAVVPGTPDASPTAAPAPTSSVEPVSMYRGGLDRTGVMSGPAPTGRPGVLWRADVESEIQGPVVVGAGLVFAGTLDGSVHAFDMATGAEVWKLTGNTTIESPSIVLDGATAYIAGYDGMVLAVDAATGAERWRTDPALNVSRRIAFDAGTQTLYVGGLEAVSYAFDSATGQLKWQTYIQAPQASVASIVTGDTLYFGIPDGLLYALNTADGSIRWTYDSTLDGFGSLTFANNTIFGPAGPANDPAFVAVDAGTGAERWRITSDSAPYSAAGVLDGNVMFGTNLGEVLSVSQVDGHVNWTFATGNGMAIFGPPGIVGDEIYVVDIDGSLYALDAATGQELWRVKLDGGINYNPAVTGGIIYLGTWEGGVYALGDDGTELPAATPVDASQGDNTGAARIVWESDDGDAELTHALGVTLAPDGSIWVADGAHSRFQIFGSDGTLLEVWGEQGSGDGQFDFIVSNGDGLGGVAFAPDGSFYVADSGNVRIQHFDADRAFLNAWGSPGRGEGQFVSISGIVIDSLGNLYVSDYGRDDIQKFDAGGALLLTIGGSGSGPGQLRTPDSPAIGPDDSIWVANPNSGRISHFASDGTLIANLEFTSIPGEPVWVQSLAVDAQGRVYLADIDGTRLFVLGSDGTVLGVWSLLRADGTANPNSGGLVVTDDGAMYLTDWASGTLYRYELDPPLDAATSAATSGDAIPAAAAYDVELLWETTGGDGGLAGATLLTISPDSTIWVADPGNGRFQIFDTDGAFLESWTGTGDGQFGMFEDDGDPYGAVAFATDGSFYVLDPGARQVLAFSADRTFVSRFGGPGRGPGQFVQPISIVADPAGNVAVLDPGRGDIQTFAPDGTLVATADLQSTHTGGFSMNSMTIDGDGNFYVLEFDPAGPPLVEKFDPEGTLLQQFGLGPGPGTLQGQPLGIGLDEAGNVYVTEIEPARVVVFSPEGEYLIDFGAAGDETVEFPFPFDVAVDAQGNVYVTDGSQSKLVKLRLPQSIFPVAPGASASPAASVAPQSAAEDVELLWETGGGHGGLDTPSSIALSPDGTIWVADLGNGRFQIFDAEGAFLESWIATDDGDPIDSIVFAADGSFYVLDRSKRRVHAFDVNRTFVRSIGEPGCGAGQFLKPIDVAIDPAGNLAVLDEERGDTQIFAADGTLVATIPLQSTGAYEMNSFSIDAEGNFYVSELSEDSPKQRIVEKFDPEGTLLQQFGVQPGPGQLVDHPGGIAVDDAGNLYVTEFEGNPRVVVFTPEGEYLTEFGQPGSAAIVFESPNHVVLDGQGNVYVTDGFQNRLVKLRLPQSLAPATPET